MLKDSFFSHDILVFDLEASADVDEYGFQKNEYIIEWGCVLLSRRLEILAEHESFFNIPIKLSSFIEDLTGISDKDLIEAPSFSQGHHNLMSFLADHKVSLKKLRLASWGTYFDGPLLRSSYQREGIPFPFSGTLLDIKTLAMVWLAIWGQKSSQCDPKHLANLMGLSFHRQHRALDDARLASRVLQRIAQDLEGISPVINGKRTLVHVDILSLQALKEKGIGEEKV